MSSPDRQAPGWKGTVPKSRLSVGADRSHPVRLPEGMPARLPGVKRWSVFDTRASARHCRAQADGMTPPAVAWRGR
jgi:hypothetical protein